MRFLKFTPSKCTRIKEVLSSYQDNELITDDRLMVEAHLKYCAVCQEELDSLRQTMRLVQQIPVITSSRSFIIADSRKIIIWNRRLKALCGATILAALGVVLLFTGDANHYFDAKTDIQIFDGLSQPSQVIEQIPKYAWPVKQAELGLSITLIILTICAVVYWANQRRSNIHSRD